MRERNSLDPMSNTDTPGAGRHAQTIGITDFSTINYRPLTDADNAGAFREFKQWSKATKQPWLPSLSATIVASIVAVFVLLLLLSIVSTFGAFIGGMIGTIADNNSALATGSIIGFFIPGLIVLAIGIPIFIRYLRSDGTGGQWEKWYRMFHFANTNRMQWHARSHDPNYPGSIFQIGSSRSAYDHFTADIGRYLDIGNLQYTTGSGKSQTTHNWGFMALKLDRRIPHCVLDATANNGFFGSNMPLLKRDQILHLEGDFDRFFTLYCPREYERDALYIFTPDLMALLIDNVSAFDVEIVDDWMFVYSVRPWELLDPWLWHRLFTIVHTVGNKTVDRTDFYRDARALPAPPLGAIPAPPSAANNFVAPQGQRLKRRFSWWPLIIVGAILLLPGIFLIAAIGVSFLTSTVGGG